MTKTTKSDVSSVAFEKALDGVGRAEIESRYRRAVFEVGEMSETLRICQKRGTELHEEIVELKDHLRIAQDSARERKHRPCARMCPFCPFSPD